MILDDIYSLKEDLEECIIKDSDFEGIYNFFIFEKNNMSMTNDFSCFENLNITLENSLLKLNGKIAEDIKQHIDYEKMKQRVSNKNKRNLIEQIIENNKTDEQKNIDFLNEQNQMIQMFDEMEQKDFNFRKVSQKDKDILLNIKEQLKEMNLDLDYEEAPELVMLSGIYKNLNFSKYELRELVSLLAENIDLFIIIPHYEDEEDAVGIRIAIGINLIEE